MNRRVLALGRAEALLLRRNAIALVTALVLPASLLPVLRSAGGASEADGAEWLGTAAAIVVVLASVALLFAVYYNLVTALVARREDFVLKRLRTGEASDAEIVAGTALPAAAVAWVQCAVGGVAAFALFGMAAPVNVLLVVVALGLGTVVFVLLAVVTTTVTRTAEMAQVTTTPALFVSFTFSGMFLPLDTLPDLLEHVGRLLPLTPVVDLLRLGLTGTTPDGDTVGLAASFGEAVPPVLVLLAWAIGCGWASRRWFRWEPRR